MVMGEDKEWGGMADSLRMAVEEIVKPLAKNKVFWGFTRILIMPYIGLDTFLHIVGRLMPKQMKGGNVSRGS
jgi:hypothetical protein